MWLSTNTKPKQPLTNTLLDAILCVWCYFTLILERTKMKQYYYQIMGNLQNIEMSSDEISDDYFTNKQLCQRVANREARDMSKLYNQDYTAIVKELETAL